MFKAFEDQPLLVPPASEDTIPKPGTNRGTASVERLEHLRNQVLAGTYRVDADRLADAMLLSPGPLDEVAVDRKLR